MTEYICINDGRVDKECTISLHTGRGSIVVSWLSLGRSRSISISCNERLFNLYIFVNLDDLKHSTGDTGQLYWQITIDKICVLHVIFSDHHKNNNIKKNKQTQYRINSAYVRNDLWQSIHNLITIFWQVHVRPHWTVT